MVAHDPVANKLVPTAEPGPTVEGHSSMQDTTGRSGDQSMACNLVSIDSAFEETMYKGKDGDFSAIQPLGHSGLRQPENTSFTLHSIDGLGEEGHVSIGADTKTLWESDPTSYSRKDTCLQPQTDFEFGPMVREHEPLMGEASLLSRPSIEDGTVAEEEAQSIVQKLSRAVWGSGTACILISSAVQAISAVLVKQMAGRIPVTEMVVVRSIICFAMSVPIAQATGIRPLFAARQHWPHLFKRGLAGALSLTLYYEAVRLLPLADAMALFFSNPAITAVLGWVVHGEPLHMLTFAGIFASLAGVTLVTQPPFLFGHSDWNSNRLLGSTVGIASSVMGATAYVLIRFIPDSVPSLVVALWFHTMAILTMLPPLAVGFPERAVVPGLGDSLRLAGVGLTSFAAQLMINRAFRLEAAFKMATMSLTQVLYGHILGVLFFSDRESFSSLAGTGLLGLGVVTVNLRRGVRKQPDQEMAPMNASAAEEQLEGGEEGDLELVEAVQPGSAQGEQGLSLLVPQWSGIETHARGADE